MTLPQYGTPPWQIWVDTSRPHITRSTLQMTSTALGKFGCLSITSWGWSSWCSTSRTIRSVKMVSCRSEMERIPFLLHLDDSVVTNFPKCLNHLRMRWKLNLRLHLWEASLKYPTLPGKVSVQVFRSCYFNRLYYVFYGVRFVTSDMSIHSTPPPLPPSLPPSLSPSLPTNLPTSPHPTLHPSIHLYIHTLHVLFTLSLIRPIPLFISKSIYHSSFRLFVSLITWFVLSFINFGAHFFLVLCLYFTYPFNLDFESLEHAVICRERGKCYNFIFQFITANRSE